MKKYFLVSVIFLIGAVAGYAQTGAWSGNIEAQGIKLPIVFHLDDEKPTADSPAQRAKGIPIQISRPATDSIFIEIPSIGASYKGKCEGDEIRGTFNQRGFEVSLVLHPGDMTTRRPQTPKPPFPYSQEEVSFANGNAVLKGTLTLPEGYSRETPVLIMITGSGLQNRDEEIFEHKPFAVLADALARNGIATLRYDDRGYGESTGDAVFCTTEDLKNDALAGINLLRQRFDKVGVLGHSEGGTIALMLAADKKADFIVSMAGMVISGKETLMDQNRYALYRAGYPPMTVEEYCNLISLVFDNDESATPKLEASNLPDDLKQNLYAVVQQVKIPYMQYFIAMDMREKLGDIDCPVLALNGTKDTQVYYKKNIDALKAGLPTNEVNRIMAMEGLNHMFQHCETGAITEYATIEETISPEVLDLISRWIRDL